MLVINTHAWSPDANGPGAVRAKERMFTPEVASSQRTEGSLRNPPQSGYDDFLRNG